MLSQEQMKTLSGITANIGHIFFGSVAIPFWLNPKGFSSFLIVITGLFIAFWFWAASIKLTK